VLNNTTSLKTTTHDEPKRTVKNLKKFLCAGKVESPQKAANPKTHKVPQNGGDNQTFFQNYLEPNNQASSLSRFLDTETCLSTKQARLSKFQLVSD